MRPACACTCDLWIRVCVCVCLCVCAKVERTPWPAQTRTTPYILLTVSARDHIHWLNQNRLTTNARLQRDTTTKKKTPLPGKTVLDSRSIQKFMIIIKIIQATDIHASYLTGLW